MKRKTFTPVSGALSTISSSQINIAVPTAPKPISTPVMIQKQSGTKEEYEEDELYDPMYDCLDDYDYLMENSVNLGSKEEIMTKPVIPVASDTTAISEFDIINNLRVSDMIDIGNEEESSAPSTTKQANNNNPYIYLPKDDLEILLNHSTEAIKVLSVTIVNMIGSNQTFEMQELMEQKKELDAKVELIKSAKDGGIFIGQTIKQTDYPRNATASNASDYNYQNIDRFNIPSSQTDSKIDQNVVIISSQPYEPKHQKNYIYTEISEIVEIPDTPDKPKLRNFSQSPPKSQPTHPWTSEVKTRLSTTFKLNSFRVNQLEAINAALSGKDCFVLMPTGGGKSLCYQLPATCVKGTTNGITVVISPLLSLIQDQVNGLIQLGIPTLTLSGDITADRRKWVYSELNNPNPTAKLVYITPEMMMRSPQFQSTLQALYKRNKLARFVIDEAHCVSQWGHDFRPDYKELACLKGQYPGIPFMALTATANKQVQLDILSVLQMQNCSKYEQSFNRPNLIYKILPKNKETTEKIVEFIYKHHAKQSGIVYCLSKKACEEMAEKLTKAKLKAAFYHAGLHKEDRARIQNDWGLNRLHIIVATVAFGMGIDKPDVRYVIHFSLPQSLEGYYQETGRAGRDGKESTCLLFYNYRDKSTIDFLIDKGEGNRDQKDRQRNNLSQVIGYCENKIDCRRKLVLQYFGEDFDTNNCRKTCDNCCNNFKADFKDIGNYAKDIISLFAALKDENVTINQAMDIYRGMNNQKIRNACHDKLEMYGKGKELKRNDLERIFHFLMINNVLKETYVTNAMGFVNGYVQLGKDYRTYQNGRKLMFPFLHDEERKVNNGDETIWKNNRNTSTSSFFQNQNEQLPQKSLIDKQTAKKKQRTIEINTDLFLELKEMRNQIVSQAKFKDPKIIFTDTELYKMCEDMPEKYEDIRGEKTRVDKYGMVFFQIIQKFKRAKMVKPNVVFRNSSVGGNGTSKIRSMKGVF